MATTCPNINTKEWKLLEKQVGTKEAYRAYIANGNEIPTPQIPARIKKDVGFKDKVLSKVELKKLDTRLMYYNMERDTAHFIESASVADGYNTQLVLNYLPFNTYEQIKLDASGNRFLSTIDIPGAKAAQLNVTFEVNEIDTDAIDKQIDGRMSELHGMLEDKLKITRPKRLYSIKAETNEDLNDEFAVKLTEILAKNGIAVRNGVKNLKTRKGMTASAIADLTNRMILVAKGTRPQDVLGEEAAHFAIGTMDTNSELYGQIMRRIEKHPSYPKVVEEYTSEYNNDPVALKEEAAGQLLGKIIEKKFIEQKAKQTDSKLTTLLKGLWSRIQRLFGRVVYNKFQTELEEILGNTAESILNEETAMNRPADTHSAITQMAAKQHAFYNKPIKTVEGTRLETDPSDSREEQERTSTLDIIGTEVLSDEQREEYNNQLKNIVGKMAAELDKRRKILNASSSKLVDQAKERDRVRQLEAKLKEGQYLVAITDYIDEALKDVYGYDYKVDSGTGGEQLEHYPGAIDALETIKLQLREGSVQDINEIARQLRDINNFIISYDEVVKDIADNIKSITLLNNNPEANKKLKALISELQGQISTVESQYYTLGAEIFTTFLGSFLGRRNQTEEMENLDVAKALKQAERDIGFFGLWTNAMAETTDDVLKLIDSAVKTAKYTAQHDSRIDQKDLLGAQAELEAAGHKNISFVYEMDDDGLPTGNLVSQYGVNYDAFFKARDRYKESLGPFPVRDEYKSDSAFNTAKGEYRAKMAKWDSNNTQAVPDEKEIIERKKRELNEFNFALWNNMVHEDTIEGPVARPLKELRMPKTSKYQDPTYRKLDNAQKEFLDTVWEIKRKTDDKLNPKFVKPQQAPMIRKDMIETMKQARSVADAKKGIDRIKEHFKRTEDDTEYGGVVVPGEEGAGVEADAADKKGKVVLTDVRNRPVKFLPIFFTKRLKDMKDLSLDIVATMSAHSAMANDYHQMENIIHLLEIGKDYIFDKRGVPMGNNIFEALSGRVDPNTGEEEKRKALKEQGQSRMVKRLKEYFDMQIYGHYKEDEGTILGLDTTKLVDAMSSYVAINNLALNVYAGFANVIFGTSNIRIEAFSKRHFDHSNLMYADKTYTRDLPGMLAEMGKRNKTSKLALFTEFFDTLQDFEQDTASMNATRHTRMSQLATMSSLFFLNHAGEHYMQTRTALALSDRIKLKDKDGNEVSLYDAMEVKGNKLVLKEEFEGQFDTSDLVKFRKKMNAVNQSLHGVYNKLDRNYMQKFMLGRLALMFRKFLAPSLLRRFGSKKWNYQLDDVTEGYYRATGHFMMQLIRDIKAGGFSIVKSWNKLNEREKSNMMRSMAEVSYMLALLTLAIILEGLADDEEDKWMLNMMAYQANRVFTEFAMYIPLLGTTETLKILKSPAAAVNQLTTLTNFTKSLFTPMTEMESGQFKGWKRWQRYGVDLIPVNRTLRGWLTPEEKLKYFTQPVY